MIGLLECSDCGAVREIEIPGLAGRCPNCNSLAALLIQVSDDAVRVALVPPGHPDDCERGDA